MHVLVLNAGSTSLKLRLYDMDTETVLVRAAVSRIGGAAELTLVKGDDERTEEVGAADHRTAIRLLLERLTALPGFERASLRAVGHRVVHGGESMVGPRVVDEAVKEAIRAHACFAPIHNPANLAGIEAAMAELPEAKHVAVFDTAFHADLPEAAYRYGVPEELYVRHGVRRYGFHGPSHAYMAQAASEFLGIEPRRLRLVTLHLGGGASACAIEGGRSVETSMGMTPLEGLLMGTRAGDLDPALPLLLQRLGHTPDDVDRLLNERSGLLGLSGVSSDFRDVERAADAGNDRAKLALEVFVQRVKKYVGAYAALLGGIDALVFTGGIGENSARVRKAVCEGLTFLGVQLDENANDSLGAVRSVADVATHRSPTRVLVVRTDEERMIARDVVRTLAGPTAARTRVTGGAIPIGVSVRHVHLSRAHCDILFGEGYELTLRRAVTQPGQFVCRETVDLVGPKGSLARVAIINPLRKETQVEVAKTDAFVLGVDPPMRESGKLDGTPGIVLRGPHGEVAIDHGVIIAHRHVHMSPADATRFGVKDGARIEVRVDGAREGSLGDVVVRVRDDFALDLHVDTDEANAFALHNDSVVTLEDGAR